MAERRVEPEPDKMKRVGVIGGLGPQATIDFIDRFHKFAPKVIRPFVNRGYPPVMDEYIRHAPMLLDESGEPIEPLQPDPELLAVAKRLGKNSDFLVIASNTPHLFIPEVEEAAGVKVLSMIDAVVAEVQKRGFEKVGIMAVGITLKSKLYQRVLDEKGISWIAIPDQFSTPLDDAAWAVMEGKNPEDVSRPAHDALEHLRGKENVDGIILGCTEFPLLLGSIASAPDILHSTQILAEAAVRFAVS